MDSQLNWILFTTSLTYILLTSYTFHTTTHHLEYPLSHTTKPKPTKLATTIHNFQISISLLLLSTTLSLTIYLASSPQQILYHGLPAFALISQYIETEKQRWDEYYVGFDERMEILHAAEDSLFKIALTQQICYVLVAI